MEGIARESHAEAAVRLRTLLRRAPFLWVLSVCAAMGVALFVLAYLNVRYMSFSSVPSHFPQRRFYEGWTRWDSGWYSGIADDGYSYNGPAEQSPVAFFPGYPAMMRAVGEVVGNTVTAGVIVSFTAGVTAVIGFRHWCARMVNWETSVVATLLLVTYPFAFYLFGVVYSDALFLVAVVLAIASCCGSASMHRSHSSKSRQHRAGSAR